MDTEDIKGVSVRPKWESTVFSLLLLPKWWLFADMNECKISQFITPNIKNIHIWVRHLFGPPKKIKNQLKFRFKGYIVAEGNSPLTLQLKY